MPAPLIPLLALVAAGAAVAMSKKSSSAASSGVPAYPGAAGALNSGATALGTTPAAPAPINAAPSAPVFAPQPMPDPAPVAAPPAAGTVTLLPVTIVGQPDPAAPAQASVTAPWDAGTMVLPSPSSLPAIPGTYAAASNETGDIQFALNNWAAAVGFQAVDAKGANLVPLTTDGLYGPDTQLTAAGFQVWSNAVNNAGLSVDGLAGPQTQTTLLDWGTITPGGY